MPEILEPVVDTTVVYEEDVLASICRDSFFEFVKEFWGIIVEDELIINWHIKYLCAQLQKVAERVFEGRPKKWDLVINVPPGSSKSTICSQCFPAWVWTRMPGAKFICASYAHPVALKDSLKTRDIVQSEKYQRCFPGIALREDENTKGLFTNTQMGSRLAVSIGGAVTGYHAHFILVDDPINPEEAYSDAMLKTANRWMTTTLPTRKVDKRVTPLILIQQRLHQADPSGEMLARPTGRVKHICLPGEATEHISPPALRKYYTRVEHMGAERFLLDPIRLPADVLDDMLAEMGSYGFASQILQEPVPLGGGQFEVDKIVLVDELPFELIREVRAWDKAGTKDGGAYSVGLRMGRSADGRYGITDVRRKQWGSADREANIKKTAEDDGDTIEVVIEVEGGSGGKESGENTVKNLAGFRTTAYHPTGDKETRAYHFSSMVGGGAVYCLKRAWTKNFIDELRYFPNSKYKDQVDAASTAFNRLVKKKKKIGALW